MRQPPFTITQTILKLTNSIATSLGRFEGLAAPPPQPKLRRENQIKTIQGTLAIEGNTLTLDQVTAILENKRVFGAPKEILEVQNAIATYHLMEDLNPYIEADLLKTHRSMMHGLVKDSGKYRSTNVGIIKGQRVSHVAPKHTLVPKLMTNLFSFVANDKLNSNLIKSCIFHYELEFIHPFTDGNGRMGRFWQHLLLIQESKMFSFIPMESIIHATQQEYYSALAASDKLGESTPFIEYSLAVIDKTVKEFLTNIRPASSDIETRLQHAAHVFGQRPFARKDYLNCFKTISTATASRDLATGNKAGRLIKEGDKSRAIYRFLK